MNKNIPLLSVVVPVYNTAPYLKQCLDSVITQTYSYLEIILVDDGSTDGAGEICKTYESYDPRVKVVQQSNQGVAIARKNGLEKATGSYVVFIDSDDYIDKDYFEKMINAAGNYDLVTTGIILERNDKHLVFDVIEEGEYVGKKQLEYVIDNMIIYKCGSERGLTSYMVNKLYRTDYAKRVIRQVNKKVFYGEDSEFLYRYVLECSSVHITDICGYYYCNREQSTTHRTHDNYLTNINELYLSLKELFDRHERRESLLQQLQIWMSIMIRLAPLKMGFSELAQISVRYVFPLYEEIRNKEIILYGAGTVGREYYLQLSKYNDTTLKAWTDKNAESYQENNYPVISLFEAIKQKYDYIVIAVSRMELMNEIKAELVKSGIPEEKIIWKDPIRLTS